MIKRKYVYLAIAILVGIVGFYVVYRQSMKEQNSIEQPEDITVLLDWFPNTNHTGLYVAQENGYFDDENLAVEIVQPGETGGLQLVAAGKADFAVSSQEEVIQARASNVPVVSIAAIIQHNTSAFVSLADSGIVTVADFEGKRYGGWGSPIEEAVLTAVMNDAGSSYKKVENVTIGSADFFTTIGRESDFQWIYYGWDGVEAERRGLELNAIKLVDLDPALDYYTPVIITSEDVIENRHEMAERFMRAVSRGYVFAIDNPEQSAQMLITHAPELDVELVNKSQDWLSSRYQDDAELWGLQKRDVWSNYSAWLYDRQLIEQEVVAEKSFTNEFLPEK